MGERDIPADQPVARAGMRSELYQAKLWALSGVEQPRDAKGRFGSHGLAGDMLPDATAALQDAVEHGFTKDVIDSADRVRLAIRSVPHLSTQEAETLSAILHHDGAKAIPTETWLEISYACESASASADAEREAINRIRLRRRARR